jgi:glycolate oxidase FAD binding subunit
MYLDVPEFMSAIAQTLESIVGAEAVVPLEQLRADLQGAIAQAVTPETRAACVVYPNTSEKLMEVMACAHQQGWRSLPCGHGSKLSWGGLAQGIDVVISTARLNRLVHHAVGDLTVTVEAGLPFAELQAVLQRENQLIGLDPAYPNRATLGGIVATGDAGSWRQRYGGVRDMLIGLSIVRYDGQLAKAGGKVVKNVAGYDLMKLFTGSYGSLGLISELTFRTYPQQAEAQTVVLSGELEALDQVAATLRASVLTPTRADWLSTAVMQQLGFTAHTGLAVQFESSPESITEQSRRLLDMGHAVNLQGTSLTADSEGHLWQQIQSQLWPTPTAATHPGHVICKVGMLPTAIAPFLHTLNQLTSAQARINLSSGVGTIRFETPDIGIDVLQKLRSHCNAERGYFTVLEAPIALKQTLDVWGYSGNAIEVMRRIKQQFDPHHRLSPHRFIGGL